VLPPHPTKNTRVALPRTANNFIASVFLLISSSSQHARSQIQPLSGVTADQIVAVAGQIVFAADLGRRVAGCSSYYVAGPRKT